MISRVDERDSQVFTWLALAGAPFGGAVDATNNRVTTRRYLDEQDRRTFFGWWRLAGGSVRADGGWPDL
jgi:hypothetical protein